MTSQERSGNVPYEGADRRHRDIGPPPEVVSRRIDVPPFDLQDSDANVVPDSEYVPPEETSVTDDPVDQYRASIEHADFTDGVLTLREMTHPSSKNRKTDSHFTVSATHDDELISRARQMTAQFYLQRNFITEDQLDSHGRIAEEHDPYLHHATYYVLRNEAGDIVASCRKIHFDPQKGEASFPLLDHAAELDQERVAALRESGLENVVEISALVKNPQLDTDGMAVFRLYRALFQDAWNVNNDAEQMVIMACNPKLYRRLRLAFDGVIQRLGDDLDYPGQEAVPAMLATHVGALQYIKKSRRWSWRTPLFRRVVGFMFEGVSEDHTNPEIVTALRRNKYSHLIAQGALHGTVSE